MTEQLTSKSVTDEVVEYQAHEYVPQPMENPRSDREISASETYIVVTANSPVGYVKAWAAPALRHEIELARLANQIHGREQDQEPENPTD